MYMRNKKKKKMMKLKKEKLKCCYIQLRAKLIKEGGGEM